MMQVIFRCYNCETINEIPFSKRHRFCKHCGKIITFSAGEAIVDDETPAYKKYRQLKKLDTKTAEKFFADAEVDTEKIENIITANKNQRIRVVDIPDGNLVDIIIFLLEKSKIQTLDDLVWNCQYLGIPLHKLDTLLIKMRNEGMIFQPTSWSVKLV